MMNELLQEQASLYAAGMLSVQEREQFELILEFHHELRNFVAGLLEAGSAILLGIPEAESRKSPELKSRVLHMLDARTQQTASDGIPSPDSEGFVMTTPDGLVQWINPGFTLLCGYSLEELQGKKLGPILQGVNTDGDTVARMRSAVHEHRACRETILNYHKNGTSYWVEIAITPILDASGQPLWLVARERELRDHATV